MATKQLKYATSNDRRTSYGQRDGNLGMKITERVQRHDRGRTTEHQYKAIGQGKRVK